MEFSDAFIMPLTNWFLLIHVQDTNMMLVGGMTDPKGDRSLPPAKQVDPDLFAHVAERRSDGIVIKGAKAYMTGGINSHEILLMPTQAMREDERDYALSCALTLNTHGVILIFGRQTNEERKFEDM